MDEFTHLRGYTPPVAPELVVAVESQLDAYVPTIGGVSRLKQLWGDAVDVRLIEKKGHIQSYLFYQGMFRQAVVDALVKASDVFCRKEYRFANTDEYT